MAFKRFEDVIAWQHARTLTNEILSITSSLEAFRKEPELCRRLQNTALDIQSEIARSFGYHDSAHFLEGLRSAIGHAEEFQFVAVLCSRQGMYQSTHFRAAQPGSIQTCSAKTQELISFVKQQLKSRKSAADRAHHPASAMRNGINIQYRWHNAQNTQNRQNVVHSNPEQPTSPLIHGIPADDDFFSDDFDIVSGSGHSSIKNSPGAAESFRMKHHRILRLRPRQIVNKIRLRFGRFSQPICHHDPASIMVFITNRCNFRCNTCPFMNESPWSPPPNVPDISLPLFSRILDAYPGATMLGLVGGEPLSLPELDSLIRTAASRKLTVNLSTNGSLLTESRIRSLLKLPMGYLNISLDAVDPLEFQRLRGGSPDLYEKVIANAALLGSIRKSVRSDIRFYLSFVTDKNNLHRIPECISLAQQLGADTVFCQSVLLQMFLTSGEAILMDEPENRKFLESLNIPDGITLVPPSLIPQSDHDGCDCTSCIHPFQLLAVDGAGNLSPCCVIPPHPRFGNIASNTAGWRDDESIQRIRKEMLSDEPASESICIQCWERYSLHRNVK